LAKRYGENVIPVHFYNDCYVFTNARAINYIVTGENVFNQFALGILNPQSKVLFVAKECSCVTFVIKVQAIGVIAIGKECPKRA
jgi:hypothetical protein